MSQTQDSGPSDKNLLDGKNGETEIQYNENDQMVVPAMVSEALGHCLRDGLTSADAKKICDNFGVQFADDGFSIKPPLLDDWMARRVKQLPSAKSIEAVEKMLVSIQFKIMDSGLPLIQLYTTLRALPEIPDDETSSAHRVAIRLWSVAFNDVSRRRRKNIISVSDPLMDFLLSETDAFSKREPTKLFTSRFLKAMLAEADLEDKLNKSLAKPGPTSTGRGRGRGVAKSRGCGRGRGRASFYKQTPGRGAYKYVNSLPNFNITDSFVGGRLLHFAGAWTEITKDPWVLSAVSNGVAIDFLAEPFQLANPTVESLEM